jgi:hypothetical protein
LASIDDIVLSLDAAGLTTSDVATLTGWGLRRFFAEQ